MLKEWEQLSVELAMEENNKQAACCPERTSGKKLTSKSCSEMLMSSSANLDSSYACLKKLPLDCLNAARSLDEQHALEHSNQPCLLTASLPRSHTCCESNGTSPTASCNSLNNLSSCSCASCKKLEHEDLKSLWLCLKTAILRIYRETGLALSQSFIQNKLDAAAASSQSKLPTPSNERLKEVVHR